MKAGGATNPPAPCFADVLDAQAWAEKVIKQVSEEAERRGSRGSQAWEDAWRDALWTLAVQKRCVENEARRSQVTAASNSRPEHPKQPRPALNRLDLENQSQAAASLQQAIAVFQKRCIEPIHQRLDTIEERLARMVASVHSVRAAKANHPHLLGFEARPQLWPASNPSANFAGGIAAGPLPVTHAVEPKASACEQQLQFSIQELHRQLAERAVQADAEAQRANEVAQQRDIMRRELQRSEVEHEEALRRINDIELKAGRDVQNWEEAEASWRQRHSALQKQLYRTEVALGEAHVLAGTSDHATFNVRPTGAIAARGEHGNRAPSAALQLWREARRHGSIHRCADNAPSELTMMENDDDCESDHGWP